MKLNTDIGRLTKGKKETYPTKKRMNLYFKVDRTTAPATAALYISFVVVVLVAFSMFLLNEKDLETTWGITPLAPRHENADYAKSLAGRCAQIARAHGLTLREEEVLALLNYMLDHNRHHADELHDICHALEDEGKAEAAAALAEALHSDTIKNFIAEKFDGAVIAVD